MRISDWSSDVGSSDLGDIHEVFFDDVEVPATAMLGSEGQAWEIVRTSLSLERVGIPRFAMAARMLTRAVTTLKKDGRFVGSAIEQAARKIGRASCRERVGQYV